MGSLLLIWKVRVKKEKENGPGPLKRRVTSHLRASIQSRWGAPPPDPLLWHPLFRPPSTPSKCQVGSVRAQISSRSFPEAWGAGWRWWRCPGRLQRPLQIRSWMRRAPRVGEPGTPRRAGSCSARNPGAGFDVARGHGGRCGPSLQRGGRCRVGGGGGVRRQRAAGAGVQSGGSLGAPVEVGGEPEAGRGWRSGTSGGIGHAGSPPCRELGPGSGSRWPRGRV